MMVPQSTGTCRVYKQTSTKRFNKRVHVFVYNIKDVNLTIRRDYTVLTTQQRADLLSSQRRRCRTFKGVPDHRLTQT
jgi:hypothetical protein